MTTDPDYDENPFWSPDGRRLLYQSRTDSGLLVVTIDGSAPVLSVGAGATLTAGRFMPDGRVVICSRLGPRNNNDLAIVRLDDPQTVVALTADPGQEYQPTPSPDGRWLAFVTTLTGRPEVVVARVLTDGTTYRLGQRLAVSTSGGTDPAWRQDGREMIYLAPDATLMAVGVMLEGEAVTLGKPTPVFKLPADAGGWDSSWTAIPDFTKFVVVEAPHATNQRFRLLTDWMAGK